MNGTLGEYDVEDLSTPGKPIRVAKGDVVLTDEGTVIKVSVPSKARGEDYDSSRILILN